MKQHTKIRKIIIKSLDIFITSISSNDDINLLYISIFKFLYIKEYMRLLVAGCWFVLESP
jgi:hypothetical protein